MNGEKFDSLIGLKPVLVIGGFLMLTVVNIIYQLELQELKLRVVQLEDSICHRERNEKAGGSTIKFMKERGLHRFDRIEPMGKVAPRMKRDVDDSGVENGKLDHLGIPEYDIAYIYGDPILLEDNIRKDQKASKQVDLGKWHSIFSWLDPIKSLFEDFSKDLFFNYTNPDYHKLGDVCFEPLLWRNRWNDTWCRHKKKGLKQKMLVRGTRFRYFTEAKWMKERKAKDNFNMTTEGAIRVGQSGIYIIHSNIHFTDVDESGSSYTLNVQHGARGETKRIAQCLTRYPANGDSIITPCPLWQLHPLQKGDEVFMELGNFSWFRVENDTLHLALIKLNDY